MQATLYAHVFLMCDMAQGQEPSMYAWSKETVSTGAQALTLQYLAHLQRVVFSVKDNAFSLFSTIRLFIELKLSQTDRWVDESFYSTNALFVAIVQGRLSLHAVCLPSRIFVLRPVRYYQAQGQPSLRATRKKWWNTSARFVVSDSFGISLCGVSKLEHPMSTLCMTQWGCHLLVSINATSCK